MKHSQLVAIIKRLEAMIEAADNKYKYAALNVKA